MSNTDLPMNAKGTYYLCKSQSVFSVPLLYPDPGEWIKHIPTVSPVHENGAADHIDKSYYLEVFGEGHFDHPREGPS